ncbi:hypothetical protein KEM55_004456 [Ascosphaera atra]|nr:hypothetical protein KEM55_004456 [Ascosphaera atra]
MQNIADNVESLPSKDVWGNEDPRRQERQHMRTISDDPLAAIKRGVRQLRDVEKVRKQAEEERRQSLEALRDEDRDLGIGAKIATDAIVITAATTATVTVAIVIIMETVEGSAVVIAEVLKPWPANKC